MEEESEMAGDWIKMRTALAHDPAVIAMALDLDKGEFEIVGMLHHIWGWADSQSQDGHIKRVTPKWIDRFVHCDGFAKSMEMAKWLAVNDDGIEFPNFDRHNGDSAKKRAEDAERKRKSREKLAADDPSKTSGEKCDQNRTREEKRREDKEQDLKTMSESFAIFWKLYPKKVSKADAVKAWGKIKKDLVPTIMGALSLHCVCEQWVKDDGKFIPNAATWLNKQKWEDEVKPYVTGTNTGTSGQGRPSLVDRVRQANAQHLVDDEPPFIDERDWPEFDSLREIDGALVGADD
jgi:hypothetical protein